MSGRCVECKGGVSGSKMLDVPCLGEIKISLYHIAIFVVSNENSKMKRFEDLCVLELRARVS